MDKIYGTEMNRPVNTKEVVDRGYISEKEPVFIFNLDLPHRSHGVAVVLSLAYCLLAHCLPINR